MTYSQAKEFWHNKRVVVTGGQHPAILDLRYQPTFMVQGITEAEAAP